jgi:hypothetical protein
MTPTQVAVALVTPALRAAAQLVVFCGARSGDRRTPPSCPLPGRNDPRSTPSAAEGAAIDDGFVAAIASSELAADLARALTNLPLAIDTDIDSGEQNGLSCGSGGVCGGVSGAGDGSAGGGSGGGVADHSAPTSPCSGLGVARSELGSVLAATAWRAVWRVLARAPPAVLASHRRDFVHGPSGGGGASAGVYAEAACTALEALVSWLRAAARYRDICALSVLPPSY